jgi:oxygen-independent coproporphyrinogen-3 oxidase
MGTKGSLKFFMPPIRHLYVHIPFCPKICPYCSFYKEASDRNKTQRFLEAVLLELDRRLEQREVRPETIFFGGGTPSALSTPQLDFLLSGLRARLDLRDLREWTLEMNPATVSLEKARLLLDLGVNRISMGVQSWDDRLLQVLGRVHQAAQAERSYEILRAAGCANVNLDFMFSVPTQRREEWEATLEKTISLQPEHISAYCLTYEEDTAFFERFRNRDFIPDESLDADLFETTMARLAAAGYGQYEISNYARPGRECRHNLAYWLGHDYLGLGPSAFSTVGARRWQNVADTAAYCDRVHGGAFAESFCEDLDERTRAAETIAFSLRTDRGVARELVTAWEGELEQLAADGFVQGEAGHWRLTAQGKMVADTIAETFV